VEKVTGKKGKSYKDHREWDRCRAWSYNRVLRICMPSFASFADFIANLSPRRQQPADRRLQHQRPSHCSNPASTRCFPSPTPAGPRRRIDSARHQFSLGSDLEENHHGPRHIRFSPHLARDQDIDASAQVCGFQLYYVFPRSVFLHLLFCSTLSIRAKHSRNLNPSFQHTPHLRFVPVLCFFAATF
jgi:hypothetical protein